MRQITKFRKPLPTWRKVRKCIYNCGNDAAHRSHECYDCGRRKRSQAAQHVEGASKLYS